MNNLARSAAVITGLTLAVLLSACASSPRDWENSEPLVDSDDTITAQGGCPEQLIVDFDYNDPNNSTTEVDISAIESAFGAELPDDLVCVVVSPVNRADGEVSFYIFWPGKDQNFAYSVGNTLIAAGVPAFGDPIEYRRDGATMALWAYPAGDSMHWSDSFVGSPQLVVGEGAIPDKGYVR
ncbi:hypothetical protein FB472_1189 [Rhodoglobus vestalii]|uniref:LppP/LprE lipoprotein n=1 Tax=Rhodoglobus vestalii TaxID=193384 RepID=A0A8H2KAD4_9MICO|nr:hypothetical protein [Rhodoglobus vestalii]TQO19621.1 hypothetical protein FB472_1189 [Rhodoglobus vestalii]